VSDLVQYRGSAVPAPGNLRSGDRQDNCPGNDAGCRRDTGGTPVVLFGQVALVRFFREQARQEEHNNEPGNGGERRGTVVVWLHVSFLFTLVTVNRQYPLYMDKNLQKPVIFACNFFVKSQKGPEQFVTIR